MMRTLTLENRVCKCEEKGQKSSIVKPIFIFRPACFSLEPLDPRPLESYRKSPNFRYSLSYIALSVLESVEALVWSIQCAGYVVKQKRKMKGCRDAKTTD